MNQKPVKKLNVLLSKSFRVLLNTVPVLAMIGFIPLIANDYMLTLVYLVIIIGVSYIKYEKGDLPMLITGFCLMTVFEAIFISTGVETFQRNSLLGIMPLWLPILWSYGFVAIKRAAIIITE